MTNARKQTILYIPPPERAAEVFAASVGGGRVPVGYRKHPDVAHLFPPEFRSWRIGIAPRDIGMAEHALVLAINGTLDPLGYSRARDILASVDGRAGRCGSAFGPYAARPAEWILSTPFGEPFTGRIYSATSKADTLVPALATPPARLDGDMLDAWALATILAARLGGSVEVVGE